MKALRLRGAGPALLVAAGLGGLVAAAALPARADGDEAARVAALERRIEALEARLRAFEQRQTFTSFMPGFAERFHVMHKAGEAGDWAVAEHEMAELKRLTAIAPTIDAEKGRLMQAMLGPQLEKLEEAIEGADEPAFSQGLEDTIATCNACHTATGSAFVQVTLDVDRTLSMRHPHKLVPRRMADGHRHQHGGEAVAGAGGHDEAEAPQHAHGHGHGHADEAVATTDGHSDEGLPEHGHAEESAGRMHAHEDGTRHIH